MSSVLENKLCVTYVKDTIRFRFVSPSVTFARGHRNCKLKGPLLNLTTNDVLILNKGTFTFRYLEGNPRLLVRNKRS